MRTISPEEETTTFIMEMFSNTERDDLDDLIDEVARMENAVFLVNLAENDPTWKRQD